MPFVKYLLGTILSSYKDFEDRMEIMYAKLPAKEMVRKAVLPDIWELCSSLSIGSIEEGLRELVKKGAIQRLGQGKSTRYVRLI